MKLKRGETFETTIESLALGGLGVGCAPDGRVAFVEGAAPKDTVRAVLTKVKPDWVQARMHDVIIASPHRVAPRCPHFGACGGCRLQHVDYPEQARQKELQVADALRRIGGLRDVTVLPVMPADEPWHYRNKMEFTFAPGERAPLLGLHERGSFSRIVDLDVCYLLDERVGPLLHAVRGWAERHRLQAHDPRRSSGLLRFLVLRSGKATGEVMVDLVTTALDPPEPASFVTAVHTVLPEATVVHTTHRGPATAYIVEQQEVLAGRGRIRERVGDLVLEISPESFFQTNTRMAARLFDTAAQAAGVRKRDRILDLYCGTGAIGLTLARMGARVVGVEASEAAVADARRNAEVNGVAELELVMAKAEDALADVITRHGPFDAAVVDPPRAGLHPRATGALAASPIQRLAYVSCNPATLARDISRLVEAGFTVLWVRPVDMFPQTPHIEAIVSLSRTRRGARMDDQESPR